MIIRSNLAGNATLKTPEGGGETVTLCDQCEGQHGARCCKSLWLLTSYQGSPAFKGIATAQLVIEDPRHWFPDPPCLLEEAFGLIV